MLQPLPPVHLQTINTLRVLAIDAIEKAKSGHPGLPLGAAPMAYALWHRHLNVCAQAPKWPDRDRFVLSAGHGSMLLYALLHLYGFDVSRADLQAFRALGSKTPGHPEFGLTDGVEATTGPLGQGAANTVGMAIAERAMAHRFNRPGHTLIDHRTYALVSDGDIMEGVVHEAASLAGHLALGRLTWLYDANAVTLDGPAQLSDSEKVAERFGAYGWQVLTVSDGDHDVDAIDTALNQAHADSTRPTLIIVRTTIGYGAPTKQGKSTSHGAPLGGQEAADTRRALGFGGIQPFDVPHAVAVHVGERQAAQSEAYTSWQRTAAAYAQAHPELWAAFDAAQAATLPEGWDVPLLSIDGAQQSSTREASGKALNALAATLPNLMGGDGDLSVSTLTAIGAGGDFDGRTGAGRNIRFGVREHAMAAALNGMAYHGGLRPYGATFFVFSDYMRPSLRMAAMSGLQVLWVFTHDSLGVGEDGATHQPIEHLMALRAMPNVTVVRPADTTETVALYHALVAAPPKGPVAMVLGRQKLPSLKNFHIPAATIARGGYLLRSGLQGDHDTEQGILIATGSEVHVALEAQQMLWDRGVAVRVVSMPSWELLRAQPHSYLEALLPTALRARVSVEAGTTLGWERYVGADGTAVGVDTFGASGTGDAVMRHFGISAERVAQAMVERLRHTPN